MNFFTFIYLLFVPGVYISASPLSRVLSPPTYKPIRFFYADKYEAWHGAVKDEIQVLHAF
jgi:hypothetical protein